jgi:hypothetical protein
MAAVLAVAVAGCARGAAGPPADEHGPAHRHGQAHQEGPAHQHVDTANGAPDVVLSGPQGRVPQFVVECGFSHAAPDDPIVHPGAPGASHLHVFFGATGTDAASTAEALSTGATTCDQPLDTAAYWAPALLRDGEVVAPVGSVAYYRAGPGVDPATVEPYPFGLMMVAGNAAATAAQPLEVVAWSCGAGSIRAVTPPRCPENRNLRLLVTFPDCWNGTDLRGPDTDLVAHVAYSHRGECGPTHPVPVPQLQLAVEYPVTGSPDGLELASGGLLTAHADFVNSWHQDRLEREVRNCLHRQVVCDVSSSRTDGQRRPLAMTRARKSRVSWRSGRVKICSG